MEIEFIEKQAAIEALGEEPEVWSTDNEWDMGAQEQWRFDHAAIKAILPADVRPVVRGRWINKERVGFGSVEAECSNCGRRMIFNNAWICCPWCMADMSGGDTE